MLWQARRLQLQPAFWAQLHSTWRGIADEQESDEEARFHVMLHDLGNILTE